MNEIGNLKTESMSKRMKTISFRVTVDEFMKLAEIQKYLARSRANLPQGVYYSAGVGIPDTLRYLIENFEIPKEAQNAETT